MIAARTDGICENMEGAAIAQVATAMGVPAMEIRGISNIVETRDLSKWDKQAAATNCQQAVLGVLNSLKI